MTTEMENYGTMITELVFCQYPDFQKCGTFLIVRQGCSDIPIIMPVDGHMDSGSSGDAYVMYPP